MRTCGINLPSNKRLLISLTYIKGIGRTTAKKILEAVGLNESIRTKDVTDAQQQQIQDYILQQSNEGIIKYGADLTTEINSIKRHHIALRTYRGERYQKHLPVRGQRTKTNSRTARRKTKI